jgi:hypothetical protein
MSEREEASVRATAAYERCGADESEREEAMMRATAAGERWVAR